MTTSIPLPSTPASEPAAGGSNAAVNSLLDSLAAPATTTETAPGSFDQLLDAPNAAVPETPAAPPAAPAEPVALQVTLGAGNLFARGQIKLLAADEAKGAGKTIETRGADAEPAAKNPASQRDLIETAAAMLAVIFPVLPQATPAPAEQTGGDASLPGGDKAATAPDSSAGRAPSGPVVVVKVEGLPAFRLSVPALKTQTDVPLGQALEEMRELIAGKLAELPGDLAIKVAGAHSTAEKDGSQEAAVELEVELPAAAPLTPQAVPAAELPGKGMANFADATRGKTPGKAKENLAPEKNFLSAKPERVKSDKSDAGISVAQTATDMAETFTAHRYASDQQVFPVAGGMREMTVAGLPPHATAAAADFAPDVTAPESALAHRAVETILNVVDAQRSREAEAPVVNLHFKFAGEDLAVRVQMRGGEVHTQFRTDSAELRAALASEWRAMAGQGSDEVRLIEPVFAGSGSSGQNGFGSAPHGQFSSQQHAQQQQAQGPALLPGLRALRRGASAVATAVESAPRSAVALPTSQHLTAFA